MLKYDLEQHDIHATQAGLLQAESAPFRRCQTGSNRNKASMGQS